MEFERFVGCCQASAIQTFEPTKAKGKGKSVQATTRKKVHKNVEPIKRDCPGEVVLLPCWFPKLDCAAFTSATIRRKAEVLIVLNYVVSKRPPHTLGFLGPGSRLPNSLTYFRISWDLRQLSLSECVTHFLLRFWPSAQFAIAPKPFKVEV